MHWFKSFAKKCTQNVASVTLFLDILLDCEFQSDHKETFFYDSLYICATVQVFTVEVVVLF